MKLEKSFWKSTESSRFCPLFELLLNFNWEFFFSWKEKFSCNNSIYLKRTVYTNQSTCNHEPQFPVLQWIINLIFKVWGIKRSGKSLYQNTFFLFVVGIMISNLLKRNLFDLNYHVHIAMKNIPKNYINLEVLYSKRYSIVHL